MKVLLKVIFNNKSIILCCLHNMSSTTFVYTFSISKYKNTIEMYQNKTSSNVKKLPLMLKNFRCISQSKVYNCQ